MQVCSLRPINGADYWTCHPHVLQRGIATCFPLFSPTLKPWTLTSLCTITRFHGLSSILFPVIGTFVLLWEPGAPTFLFGLTSRARARLLKYPASFVSTPHLSIVSTKFVPPPRVKPDTYIYMFYLSLQA